MHAGKCEVFSLLSAACVWEQTPVEHSCRKTFPWPLQEKRLWVPSTLLFWILLQQYKNIHTVHTYKIKLFSKLTSLNCDKRRASREQKFQRRMWYHQTPFPGELSVGETSWRFFLQLLLKLACHTARFMPANDAAFSQAFWQSKVRLCSNIFSLVMSSRMTMSASLQMRAGWPPGKHWAIFSEQATINFTAPFFIHTLKVYDCFCCQFFFLCRPGPSLRHCFSRNLSRFLFPFFLQLTFQRWLAFSLEQQASWNLETFFCNTFNVGPCFRLC